jgi:hypothetical protein
MFCETVDKKAVARGMIRTRENRGPAHFKWLARRLTKREGAADHPARHTDPDGRTTRADQEGDQYPRERSGVNPSDRRELRAPNALWVPWLFTRIGVIVIVRSPKPRLA